MMTFDIDQRFSSTLDSLKRHYGCASKAETLRKAVALLKVMSEHEQPDGTLVLVTPQGHDLRVVCR